MAIYAQSLTAQASFKYNYMHFYCFKKIHVLFNHFTSRRLFLFALVGLSIVELVIGVMAFSFSLDTEIFCGISYDTTASIEDFAKATLKYIESSDSTIYDDYHKNLNNKYWFSQLNQNTKHQFSQTKLYITLPYGNDGKLTYGIDFTKGNRIRKDGDQYINVMIRNINGIDVRDIPLLKRYLYKKNFDKLFLSKFALHDRIADTPSLISFIFIECPKMILVSLYNRILNA